MNWQKQSAGIEARASLPPGSLTLLTGLVLLALLARLAMLGGMDYMIGPDGTEYANLGARLGAGNVRGIFHPYWPPLYPFLIGLSTLVTGHLELAARLVSVGAGALLVVPVYWLAYHLYGSDEALIAALLVVFSAMLIWFSVQVLTESTYLLFFSLALAAGWKALEKNKGASYFLTGLLFAACYLLRPEAFGYVGVMLALLLLRQIVSPRERRLFDLVRCVVLLLVGFFVLAAPYLLYLRAATGVWTVSAKFDRHLLGGNVYRRSAVNLLPLTTRVKQYLQTLLFTLEKEHRVFPQIYPLPLLLLTGVGLFRTRWNKDQLEKQIYLLSFLLATVFAYALTVVEFRYLLPLLPILFCWLAKGITEFESWLKETVAQARGGLPSWLARRSWLIRAGVLVVLLLYLAPAIVIVQSDDFMWKNTPLELKYAGVWIKEHRSGKDSPRVMSGDKRAAFYAQGQYVPLPAGDYDTLITQARTNRVDYIVLDEASLTRAGSELKFLLADPAAKADDLELVFQNERRAQRKVMTFRVRKEGERVVK